MKAGQLEIEIVAQVAKLQQDMRAIERTVGKTTGTIASQARAANDNLRSIGKGAGAGLQQYSRDVARLKASLDPAWASLQNYKQQINLLREAHKQGAITQQQYAQQVRLAKAAYQESSAGVVGASNAQRMGLNQLAMQLGDVSTMYALGARPAQIFASQVGQVTQAVQLMTGGTSKLAAFLSGPWGIAVIVAAQVLGPLVAKLFEAEDAAKKVEFASYGLGDAQGILGSIMDLTTGKINTQSNALIALARAQALAGQIEARRQIASARGGLAGEAKFRTIIGGNFGGGLTISRGRDASGDIASAFLDGTLNYDEAVRGLESLRRTGYLTEQKFLDLAKSITDAGVAGENLKLFEDLEKAIGGDKGAIQQFLKPSRERASRKAALSDEAKALQERNRETQRFIEGLEDEIAKTGLSAGQLRQLEVARAAEVAVTAEQRRKIDELNAAREEAISTQAREEAVEKDRKATEALNEYLQSLRDEQSLLGLAGEKRALAALALEETGFKAKWAADGLMDAAAAWEEYRRTKEAGIRRDAAFEREVAAAERLNDELREMIGLLGRVGVVGEVLGGLLGITSGNVASVGGPIGDLLNIRTGERFDEKSQRMVAVTIGDEMRKIFKLNGEFGETMTNLLQGAGTGVMAANSIFGRQSSTEQLGSALGGAAGKVAGDALGKAIGGTLGSIAGAFAPVIGGLLGSLVGGLFTKTKWGRVTLSSAGVSGAAGNDSASQRASAKAGGSFMDALQQVADAFGGSIGDFGNITLGTRHGDWRVNTGGTSLKKKKGAEDFNDDAEAAIAYAIQVAIERGAITGIRASTQNLLRASGDLQAKLDKALRFENVFKELASLKNPVAFALDELTRQFDQLRDIFAEAGATAEEYAQLEELLQLKRADAIEQARRDALSKLSEQRDLEIRILELLGRTEDALAASREMELKSLKESLRPLQSMIYGLEDARAIMEQFEPLAADLKAFKQELLSTQGRDTFSAIAARFSQTAALAKNGDVQALAQLRGTAGEFLEAAKSNAASELDYRRAVGQVLGAVDDGIFAADTQIEYAQMQIDAIAAQTDILVSIRDKLDAANTVIADNTAKTVALLQRFEGDGLRVKTDLDTPLQVEVL